MPDFHEHLRKQLRYLSRSCEAFDAGHREEAIRLAVVVRVLIHQTKTSTSLLKHLNSTTINLLSTCEGASRRAILYTGMGTIRVYGDGRHEYFASLDNSPYRASIPTSKWWNQIVFVNGRTQASRRNIVLSAANQDGGAHVDETLDEHYERLATPGFVGFVGRVGDGNVAQIEDAHLVSLRQMGYELLNSPELLQLADG